MKHTTRLLLIFALTATAASWLPVHAFAGKGDIARPTEHRATGDANPTQASWWGGAAAIGCGFGIRYRILAGNPIYNGVTAVLCLIAFVDAMD